LSEGEVAAGDEIVSIGRDKSNLTVSDITRLYVNRNYSEASRERLARAAQVEALPENWRGYFLQQLKIASGRSD